MIFNSTGYATTRFATQEVLLYGDNVSFHVKTPIPMRVWFYYTWSFYRPERDNHFFAALLQENLYGYLGQPRGNTFRDGGYLNLAGINAARASPRNCSRERRTLVLRPLKRHQT